MDIRSTLIKVLLLPASMLYATGVWLRNFFYDSDLLRQSKFSVPVISVGNLTVGGAGKTPHIEYLIRLLRPYIQVATLSRGYMRKSKGFRMVQVQDTAETAGDEPLQYARKYRDVAVAVAESRAIGIPELMAKRPGTQVILLDDAYQHRSVLPSLNILLTSYEKPFYEDTLLPVGRLREFAGAYERADVIIVTKCPDQLSEDQKAHIQSKIALKDHQKLFFTRYKYLSPYYMLNPRYRIELQPTLNVLLISAIANTSYLEAYLAKKVAHVESMAYEDHRIFSTEDINYMNAQFEKLPSRQTIILTTEKDAIRLEAHRNQIAQWKWPIFVLPVEVQFDTDAEAFDQLIKDHLLAFKS